MNKIYKVKWNAACHRYDVTSEFSRGKTKSASLAGKTASTLLGTLITTGLLILSPLSHADEVALDFFDAKDGGHAQLVSGNTLLRTTDWRNIASGDRGYINTKLSDLASMGKLSGDGAAFIHEGYIGLGQQVGYEYTDPTTGNTATFAGYQNDQMRMVNLADQYYSYHYAVGADGQYVDRNLIQVLSGATLDVDVGDSTGADWFNNKDNQLSLIMKGKNKTSSVFKVAGGELNYKSKTVVDLGNITNVAKPNDAPVYSFAAGFSGDFDSAIGHQQVNNISDLKVYNSALIEAVESGRLTPEQYQQEFKKAYASDQLKRIYIDESVPDSDATRQEIDPARVAYILSEAGTVNIDADAAIQAKNTDISVVRLTNGATLNNNGEIGTFASSSAGSVVVTARENSVVNNYGVIDAGTNTAMSGYLDSSGRPIGTPFTGHNKAVMASTSSTINNSGVINVAPSGAYISNVGVQLFDDAALNNSGHINISAIKRSGSTAYPTYTMGVLLEDSATFSNSGEVYLGREAQRTISDVTTDIETNSLNNQLVLTRGSSSFVNQTGGKLTLGSKTQGGYGVIVQGPLARAVNHGDIQINGAAASAGGSAPLQNVGMKGFASAGSAGGAVLNAADGTITLDGLNAVAMMASSVSTDRNTTTVQNDGLIRILQGIDALTKTANYGLWAEGSRAIAINAGTLDLRGEGAIGAHAREGGTIDVKDGAEIKFNGANQTGYYVFGAGSTIQDGSTTTQNVNTEDSTLYRIDGGASFDGMASTPALEASGKNATALLVTSQKGNASTLTTGGMDITVSGEGATGVRVEGSAQGTLSAGTQLQLSGKGSSAGIVDGLYTDIVGNVSQIGTAVLTSLANLTSANAVADAIGYIARNSGTLNHRGSIDFTSASRSTGVLVDGGTLNNSGTIAVNGIAVDIQGENSHITNTGTIEATNGLAAVRVGNDAELALDGKGTIKAAGSAHGVLLDTGAKGLTVANAEIAMQPGGTGNGIENSAEVEGIKLTHTHILVGDGNGVRTAVSLAQANSGVIDVNGSGSGLRYEQADGSMTTTDVDMSQSQALQISVKSASGKGIVTNTTGTVKSGASVDVQNTAGGAALTVEGETRRVEQSGHLTSVSDTSAVVDVDNDYLTEFVNSGTIQAASSNHEAIQVSANSNVSFTNATGGNITGKVSLSNGNNTVRLQTGSTANRVSTGNGNDNFYLDGIKATETRLFTALSAGSGSDTLNLSDSVLTVNDQAMLSGFEKISIAGASALTLDNTLLPLGDAQNDATGTGFSVSKNSHLILKQSSGTQFASHIEGAGTLQVSTGGHAFDFTANNAVNRFTGTLALDNATFTLGGLNTQALSNAMLKAGSNSFVTVEDGVQRTGGLTFDGGTVAFDTGTPGEMEARSLVQTSRTLDVSGTGTVVINPGSVTNHHVLPPQTTSLLEQDEGDQSIHLAGSDGDVTGSGGNLALHDTSGNLITDALHTNVLQNGVNVAKATYDYRLTSGKNNDGLYVTYGLTTLDLLSHGADALSLNAGTKTGNAADLSAKLTGNGDLAIDTGKGHTVSLSNLDNNYTGHTYVRSGTLLMKNNHVLGQTAGVTLLSEAGLDMAGHTQTIGSLDSEKGSFLNLNGGALTIRQGGSVRGTLEGQGALKLEGGTLTIAGENAGLFATTLVNSGATAVLDNVKGLGTGSIINQGVLALKHAAGNLVNRLSGTGETHIAERSTVTLTGNNENFTGRFILDDDATLTATDKRSFGTASVSNAGKLLLNSAESWTLDNAISGAGSLTQNGSGLITLSQAASNFTGETLVEHGGIQLGSEQHAVTLHSSRVNVAQGARFGGFGETTGDVSNEGTLKVGTLMPAARQSGKNTTFTVGGELSNSGTVITGQAGEAAGNLLRITGDYIGRGGELVLNTALGSDNAATDRMVVEGNTQGITSVSVNNAGGSGAKTIDGIEIISVKGKSQGEFTQKGRIVAGAYEYHLTRGIGDNHANWYLKNTVSEGGGEGGGTRPGKDDKIARVYRPESGAYTANMAAANTLFNTRLHDRLGETHYIDALTGEEKVTSMWLRNAGGHTRFSDSSGQQKTQANRYVMQIGGDLAQWSRDGEERFHLGVMAGYANQQSNTQNRLSGQSATGSINGYSAGLYGTWFQDNEAKTGAYVDSWAQYSWFDNTVKGDSLAAESYKSRGITASVESGYTWKLGEKNLRESYYLQPKAQVTWMGVKPNAIHENNGTRVSGEGENNIQTRVGVRAFIKGHSAIDEGKARTFEPFVEANWIANTQPFGSKLNGVTVHQSGSRNIGELKLGVEGQVKPGVNLWGNVSQQLGGSGYSDTGAVLGLKVSF